MKTTFTLLIVLISANLGLAQSDNFLPPDTTRFKFGGTEFIIIDNDTMRVDEVDTPDGEPIDKPSKPKMKAYWSGLDIGVSMLMNNQFENSFNPSEKHLLTDPANSFGVSFNFFDHFVGFGTNHIGLVTGAGFSFSSFGFKDNYMRLHANADSTFGLADSSLISGFSKNQLRVAHFNIPLLIQINSSKSKKKNFHLAFGIIGGVRVASKMRYKYETPEGSAKDKARGRYNINPFHASLTARMGYKNLGVFASFNMLPLFENGASRVAKPLSFGASLHF